MGDSVSKGNLYTYRACLEQQQDEWLPTICSPNHKSLQRSLNWVQSHIQCRCAQHHITISRLCPWSTSGSGKGKHNPHAKIREGVRSLSLSGSNSGVKCF